MRILHLTTFLQGGAGLAIVHLATAQRRMGHEVAVVTSLTGDTGYGNYPSHLDALASAGVPVHAVDSSFTREIAANLEVVRAVEQRLGGAASFDLIHTHAAVPSLIAMILARRTGGRVPIVQTMHGWGVTKRSDEARADLAVLNLVDRVIVPAKSSASLLQSLGVSRTHMRVVPYGVAPRVASDGGDDLHVHAIREWRAAGGLVVTCIGTLGRRKNQQLLIDALTHLGGRPRCLAVLVGDGPDAELRERAERAGVDGQVLFAGYQRDARRFLAESDCFVLPSLSEGQPLSILEAFCDGVPVLASDVPELSELVEDGVTGFLFDPRHPRELAALIAAMAGLPPGARRALAARARAVYESQFTVDGMVGGYMAEYARARSSNTVLAATPEHAYGPSAH